MLAVKREKSLSRLIRDVLEEEVIENRRYKRAREEHLDILASGFDLGTKGKFSISRDGHSLSQNKTRINRMPARFS